MFDGKGYLKYFTRYIEDSKVILKEVFEKMDEEWVKELDESNFVSNRLTIGFLNVLHKNLHCIFSGDDTTLPFPERIYNDDMYIQAEVLNDCIHMEGYNEGLSNGIEPYIKTNMFDMTEEKDYMLYIDDFFLNIFLIILIGIFGVVLSFILI